MRPALVLCRLGGREMAWVGRQLRRAGVWIWNLFFWFYRGLAWVCSKFLTLAGRPTLRDREERGSSDPERNDGDSMPKTVTERPGDAEDEGGEGEAAGGKRAPASQGETRSKRPKYEEYGVDTSDEFYCEYDSTWESEDEEKPSRRTRPRRKHRSHTFKSFERAAEDMQNFRHWFRQNQGRVKTGRNKLHMPNLDFYLGQAASEPDDCYISEFHSDWFGDYGKLERVHTFIQWLFPLQEPGLNYCASPLTPEEAEEFRKSDVAKENLLNSYKLMLDFYGIELSCEKTGEVKRAENWSDRFDNLNRRTHNNLRITRILKCLGILGFQEYQFPLVRFFLEETLVNEELPRVKESVLSYFVFAVLDRGQRRKLLEFAFSKRNRQAEFVWCPKKIQDLWLEKERKDGGGACDASASPEPSSPNTDQYPTDDDTYRLESE